MQINMRYPYKIQKKGAFIVKVVYLDEVCMQHLEKQLISEKKSAATIEKYMRDAKAVVVY